ncbi:hypothetical protein SAMN06273572_10155 [Monaibacterium marinum]|uniref:Uncharacterized protein n=1 Tax=Pontivivens marinum TaxID=1690039 RepID=A0A2C9CLM7_9RHOB|nr:hypothetical protein [Monaibacterium marinum]SOH92214.1 hypothetical protein SAMN06273572_10155 [Monaibacterium marinum]
MLNRLTLRNLFIAGLIGELAFEAYAHLLSPLLFGVALQPANLVAGLFNIYLGISLSYMVAFLIHFAVGIFAFSGFVLATHLVTRTKLIVSGAIAGFVLWFIAQGFLAQLVGRSFMMDFGVYTQSSFIGHVGMAALMGFVMSKLDTAKQPVAA